MCVELFIDLLIPTTEHSNERSINLSCYYTVANRWRVFLFGLFGVVFGLFASTKCGRSLLKKYPEFFSGGLFKVKFHFK